MNGGARTAIRAARDADVAELEQFVAGGTDWPTLISAHGVVVATRDDAVVGVLVRWPHPGHVLVERIAVAPHARRSGVGGLLLDVAEREAIEQGVNTVRAAAGCPLHPFLVGRGYGPVAEHLERRLA